MKIRFGAMVGITLAVLAVVTLVTACSPSQPQQQQQPQPISPTGRFQIVGHGEKENRMIFLVDSWTGTSWVFGTPQGFPVWIIVPGAQMQFPPPAAATVTPGVGTITAPATVISPVPQPPATQSAPSTSQPR